MTYRESLDWLYALQVHGIKLGLENTTRLCAALGVDLTSGEKRKFIHVAGTNGKGSVCAMLAAICVTGRKRTGLFTSPHLVSFRERIRLGPNLIPEEHVAEGLSKIRDLTASWQHAPTFFEVSTVLALAWFQSQHAEWIILETGMGGRLDSTNVVTPVVSVITPIALDHMQHLGPTLRDIAREKAGIIKPGVPVVSAPQTPEAADVLVEAASKLGCPLNFITAPLAKNWPLNLRGPHQRMNAAVAFAALVSARLRPEARTVAQALRTVEWPGRFQSVNDGSLILDGAHNEAGARSLVETWRAEFGDAKATIILGVLADKDVPALVRPLLEIAGRVICTPVSNPRTLAPSELMPIVRDLADVPCMITESLPSAIAAAKNHADRTLVTGSLFLVGEALAHLGLLKSSQESSAQ